jgi:glutamate synthase domain-containing protein 3
LKLPIRNVHRTVGTMLGYQLTRRYGADGLPDNTIQLQFTGSAGQSFGAFVPRGMTLTLEGDSNDYFGKGLSGGILSVHPPQRATFVAEDNIIIGNVALYGATSGEAYVSGRAGERFAVRNTGALAVVEGVGAPGCASMTGGPVVVLGRTGRNFAASMSGGTAFVLDADGDRVALQPADGGPGLDEPEDLDLVKSLVTRHLHHTGSRVASRVLDDWPGAVKRFVKVMPRDYRRVLAAQRLAAPKDERPSSRSWSRRSDDVQPEHAEFADNKERTEFHWGNRGSQRETFPRLCVILVSLIRTWANQQVHRNSAQEASIARGGRAIRDWQEVYLPTPGVLEARRRDAWFTASRSNHQGCPLGNLIPDWNDLSIAIAGKRPSNSCTRRQLS